MTIKNSKLFAMILILSFIVVFASQVNAEGLILPQIAQGGVNSAVNISLLKTTLVTNPIIFYKPSYSPFWKNQTLLVNTENVFGTIPAENFWKEGVYDYYILADNGIRFPDNGTASFVITNKEPVYENWANNFLKSDANGTNQDWHCSVHSGTAQGFVCFWSQMNTLESLRFAKGFKLTNNETYKDWSLKLAFSEYNNYSGYSTEEKLCDHSKNDYNCSSYSLGYGYTYGGAFRQGENIYFLTEAYKILKNDSLLELAKNYSNGVAEECNVWNNSFNCSSSLSDVSSAENQGAMLQGYLDIYSVTENETYKNISKNLFIEALKFTDDSPILMEALAKYYEMFGTTSAYDKMISMAEKEKDDCITNTCSPQEKAKQITAYLDVYKQTGNDYYLRLLMKKLLRPATTCDALSNEYNCSDSMQQGLLNDAYINLFKELPSTKKLFDTYKNQMLYVNQEIPINFSIEGYQTNLTFYYKQVDSSDWKNQSVDYWNDQAIIPSNYTTTEGIYEYYFQTDQERFPKDQGVELVVIPVANEDYFKPLRNFEQTDPAISCDPHGTNPDTPDFNCQREQFQSWETNSFLTTISTYNQTASINRTNLQSLADTLGNSRIDQDINNYQTESTCEYLDNDYVCETHAKDFSDKFQKPGGIRQATMILMFSNLYKESNNKTFYNRAYNYLVSPNDACDPFEGDYSCEIQPDSTINPLVNDYLAYAYWEAYKVFGESRWKTIATVLTNKILYYTPDDYSEIAGLALWDAYEQTGNTTYYDNASAVTNYFTDECTSSYSCEAHKLAMNSLLMFEGSKQTKGVTASYINKALMNLKFISPANANQYCDPIKDSFSCETPEDQGLMLMSYAKGVSEMIDLGNTSYTIGVFSNPLLSYKRNFSVTCQVNNTNRVGSYEVSIISPFKIENVSAPGGEISSTLKKVKFSGLSDNDTRNATWTLNADWGGKYQIQCVVEAFQNSTNVTVNNLHDVVNQKFNVSKLYLFQRTNTTIGLNISNVVKFDLENVIINLSTIDLNAPILTNVSNATNSTNSTNTSTVYLKILNATIDDDSATKVNETNFKLPFIFTGNIEVFNITMRSNESGDFKLITQLNTTYGGYDKKELVIYVYNSSFLKTEAQTAEVLSVNEPFKIDLTLNNTRNFTIDNLSVKLSISDDFTETSSPSNDAFVNLSDFFYYNESFEPLKTQNLIWNFYPTKVGTYNVQLIINTTNPDYVYEINKTITVLGNVYNISDDLNPSNTNFYLGKKYLWNLNISQNSAKNLTNVKAKITFPSGVTVLDTNSKNTIFSEENWSLSSAKNSTGNDVISLLNETDSRFLIEPKSNLSLSFNLSQHNQSYIFSSAKLFFLINGSNQTSTNYEVFLKQNNESNLLCEFQVTQTDSQIYSCEIPKENISSLMNLSIQTDDETKIDRIYLETKSNYTYDSGTVVSSDLINYGSLNPGKIVYASWNFQFTNKADKVMVINITSDQGASTIIKKIFYGPPDSPTEDTTTSSSGGGGGGGSFYFPGEKETKTYDYKNYSFCSRIKPYRNLYPLADFPDECILNKSTEIQNITKQFFNCFKIERSFYNHTTTLNIDLNPKVLLFGNTSCDFNFSKVIVYDIISKSVFNTTNDFDIETKNRFGIVKNDPELFFEMNFNITRGNDSKLKGITFDPISYYNPNSTNKLSDFKEPIIIVIYDKPLENKTLNKTLNKTEIKKPSLNKTEEKEHVTETNKTESDSGTANKHTTKLNRTIKKNETKKKTTKKSSVQKFITISSEKFISSISKAYENTKSKLIYFLILIILTLVVWYLNKKGVFNDVRIRLYHRKTRSKHKLIAFFENLLIATLIKIDKLFAKKEQLFVLNADLEELGFLKDKDSHRLIIDLFFIFKELDFMKNKMGTGSKTEEQQYWNDVIKNLRLVRLVLSKLLDLKDDEVNKSELENILKIIKEKVLTGRKFVREQKIKQRSIIIGLLKDISYLLKVFNKRQKQTPKKQLAKKSFWEQISKLSRKSFLPKTKEREIKIKDEKLRDKTINFYINLKQLAHLQKTINEVPEKEKKKISDQIIQVKQTLQKQKTELESLFEKKISKKEENLRRYYQTHLKKLYEKLM